MYFDNTAISTRKRCTVLYHALLYMGNEDLEYLTAVLWIRIRMDLELLPGSGSKVPDPDTAKSERA